MNTKQIKTDVLIVGAGPAGSAAAFDLASSGIRTIIVDRKRFPRDKPCGGGLTNKTLEALRYSIAPVVRAETSAFIISRKFERQYHIKTDGTLLTMVTRYEFDQFALDQAISAGASFLQVPRVIDQIEKLEDSIVVRWADIEIEAQWLVVADGANSQIKKILSADDSSPVAFGIEAVVSNQRGDVMTGFDFDVVSGGYGWVFPKGDHFNIGLFASHGHPKPMRSDLLRYIEKKAPGCDVISVQGAVIPTNCYRNSENDNKVIYIGDAGGFCDNLFGEGIYGAVVSGQLAAASILAGMSAVGVTRYPFRVMKRRYRYMGFLAFCFYRMLPFVYALFALHLDRLCKKTSKEET